jgi:thioredoxin 1
MSSVRAVTDDTFETEVLKSAKPVLVEFTAVWCGPCRTLAPILESIAAEESERLDVVAIDVDENPATTVKYGVMSMPTMMLFRDGEPVRSIVGARPKSRLLSDLGDALA